ncbi:MAG TPA: PIN domain-containing protein [Candidatus Brocadiia bacterium]|nr:PIN domain-containing protein [Candidatus Brocadiia bacterium]
MSADFFLDTNVLAYAHDALNPSKRQRAQDLVRLAVATGKGVVSTQVLSEFFVVATRKLSPPLPVETVRREIDLLRVLEIVGTDAVMVLRAIDIHVGYGISYWDALIMASAARAGCSVLYSEDFSDGRVIEGVRIVNPFV